MTHQPLNVRTALVTSIALLSLAVLVTVARANSVSTIPHGIADCNQVDIPSDREVNTLLDKEQKLLTLSYLDDQSSEDVVVTIGYEDQACLANESVRTKINHALDTDAVTQAQMCESMREGIRNNERVVRGIEVNLEAARRYVAEWCS